MNFRQLKYFVATAESGQVSRAAAALSISQSSITGAIQDLEVKLGTSLFVRTAHGMELTEPGREFLASAYDILQRVEDAQKLTLQKSEIKGSISIAATYTVIGYFLPYHLDRLAQLHPGIDVQLHELNREGIEEGLLTNRFDIALVLTSNLTNPELESVTLLKSSRRLWVAPTHGFFGKSNVSLKQISKENYIMLTVDEAAHTTMKYWGLAKLQPKVFMRTSSVEAVRSMVANGQGVTILSDMVYRPWSLEGKRIGTVQTTQNIPTMDVGLAWRKGNEFTPATFALYNYFSQSFSIPRNQN